MVTLHLAPCTKSPCKLGPIDCSDTAMFRPCECWCWSLDMVQQQISSSCIGTTRLSWLSGAVPLTRPLTAKRKKYITWFSTGNTLLLELVFVAIQSLKFKVFLLHAPWFFSCPACEVCEVFRQTWASLAAAAELSGACEFLQKTRC